MVEGNGLLAIVVWDYEFEFLPTGLKANAAMGWARENAERTKESG